MILGLEAQFSCAHFYWNPAWADSRNRDEFGLCANRNGHGHNYKLQMFAQIPFACLENDDKLFAFETEARKSLSELVQLLDHKNLNLEIAAFKEKIPTTENLAEHCFDFLRQKIPGLKKVRVFETDWLWSEVNE